ncbi:MAG: hypothetical protein K6E24_03240, partial [bacterium]|nr:hypothetical protein [bacterium]
LALKDAFAKTEELIGLPIKKVLVCVPSYNLDCFVTSGSITIKSEDKVVTHNDLLKAMAASVYNKFEDNRELVSILPTKFIINDEDHVKSPINLTANKLTVNDVAVSIPKKNSETIVKCLEKLGIEVVETCVSPLADFYEFKKDEDLKTVGAVVNIGQSNTTVSIFNKGILTACEVIDMGSSLIDNDISYVFKIPKADASFLKERLAVADIHMAKPNETVIVKDINDNDIKINEYDISAVAISRLEELSSLIKKQINLLTKKEISYIILTGGISEMRYFNRFLDDSFNGKARLGVIEEIGARNNKYSVALGMIKYYNSRLKLRNVDYSIFTLEEQEEFGGTHKKSGINQNSLFGKIYGYFFDN